MGKEGAGGITAPLPLLLPLLWCGGNRANSGWAATTEASLALALIGGWFPHASGEGGGLTVAGAIIAAATAAASARRMAEAVDVPWAPDLDFREKNRLEERMVPIRHGIK